MRSINTALAEHRSPQGAVPKGVPMARSFPAAGNVLDQFLRTFPGEPLKQAEAVLLVESLLEGLREVVDVAYKRGRRDGHGEHNECIENNDCFEGHVTK